MEYADESTEENDHRQRGWVGATVGLELGLEEEGGCEDTSEAEIGRHKACFGENVHTGLVGGFGFKKFLTLRFCDQGIWI